MNKKVRAIAKQATLLCEENGKNAAWMWEDTFGQLMIYESIKFLKGCDFDFEAEQLEEFWNDPEYDR